MSLSSSTLALARLEPFLLLAKAVKGASAAKLVLEATAAPGCYVFSELLHAPSISQLAESPEHQPFYRLLELFAYGTLQDLAEARASGQALPTLTQAHLDKLRQLSLVSTCSQARIVGYADILDALRFDITTADGPQAVAAAAADGEHHARRAKPPGEPSSAALPKRTLRASEVRRLEDTVIDAIYAGVLNGRLDQRSARFEVEGVLGRDVRGRAEIEQMRDRVTEWTQMTENLLVTLDERIAALRRADADRAKEVQRQDDALAHALLALEDSGQGAESGPGAGGPSSKRLGTRSAAAGAAAAGSGTSGGGLDRLRSDRRAAGDGASMQMDLDDDGSSSSARGRRT